MGHYNDKKIRLNDTFTAPEKVITKKNIKNRAYETSDDNLVTVKESMPKNLFITPTPRTINHKATINEPMHITEVEGKDTTGLSYYFIRPTFNYLSLDWENKFNKLPELQNPLIYTEEEGIQSDKVFSTPLVNRQFAKNPDKLRNNFRPRSEQELTKHKNVLFGDSFEYKKMNHYAKNYPYCIEISFTNKTRNEFKNRLKELSLYELMIEDYVQAVKQSASFGEKTLPVFNFNEWINKSDFEINEDTIKILSPNYTEPNNFFYNLKKLNFIGFTRKMIKAHQRDTIEILNGSECYTEIMFYKVDKFDNRSNRLIQTFWLPAKDTVNFFDTQVKYGTQYRYSCKANVLVMGSANTIVSSGDGLLSTIEPSLNIIEVPMFVDTCNIIQPPQPVPDVVFHNNKYNRDEVNILIKLNANYYNAEFIPLEQSELAQNDLVAEYNKLNRRPYFHYETEHALFEVFRMDKIPENYDEIDNHKIGEIKFPKPSTSVVLKNKIAIGKKYYYVFRSINSHGLLSNPTPIYEIELKEDADETFLELEVVDIPVKEVYQPSRDMTKNIQILPSSLHTIFDQNQTGAEGNSLRNKVDKLNLGIAKDPVWGKRFKFRFTSKDTGKKLDINVNVKLTKNKTEEDFK